MKPIHFLRGRQEKQALQYWLSIVGYQLEDRSFTNRAYLVYLIAFFLVWLIASLVIIVTGVLYLAGKFQMPLSPHLLVRVEIGLITLWFLSSLWQALHGSPLVLSETDLYMLCQTPCPRTRIVTRWFWLPWLRSALPFWALAFFLAFLLAEATSPAALTLSHLGGYLTSGVSNWLFILLLHLGLMLQVWCAGLLPFSCVSPKSRWTTYLLPTITFILLLLALFSPTQAASISTMVLQAMAGQLNYPTLLALALLVTGCLIWLYVISKEVNLSSVAAGTHTREMISSLQQYGFHEQAEQLQARSRLIEGSAILWSNAFTGWKALLWKNYLFARRRFRLWHLSPWLIVFFLSMSMVIAPVSPGSLLLLFLFVQQLTQLAGVYARADLGKWNILRQTPIDPVRLIRAEVLPAALMIFLTVTAGAIVAQVLMPQPATQIVTLLGIAAVAIPLTVNELFRTYYPEPSGALPSSQPTLRAIMVLTGLAIISQLMARVIPLVAIPLILLISTGLGIYYFKSACQLWSRMILPTGAGHQSAD